MCALTPPTPAGEGYLLGLGSAAAQTAFGVERRGEERSKLLFEIKNRSKEDAATGQHESTSGATRLSKLLPKKWPKRTTVDSGNKRVNSPHTHTYVYLLVCVCVCATLGKSKVLCMK